MKIETRDFGIIEIKDNNIITFKQPIYGFEEYTQYVLVTDSNMGNGICWLQSIEQKSVCFILMNPLQVKKDYAPVVMQDVLITLQATPKDDLDCWVIAVIGETFRQSTVNMKSPIIINHKRNLAMQVILDQDYPIRMPVFGPESEESVC
ncbi:flagellar assembly protein FliW [Clostridium transplantifaecale]|uniref:flagellar assembly protein FliW n=1 Tax=Clostridium transplantifaecale TaxID=2479838 RepID=UPI000F63E24A|nr:flagellar assembly protein FliW [Clostridium transplantifaecale]